MLFVGFEFVDGALSVRGDDFSFWYTDHTLPAKQWNRQFQSGGGDAVALRTMETPSRRRDDVGGQDAQSVAGAREPAESGRHPASRPPIHIVGDLSRLQPAGVSIDSRSASEYRSGSES